MSKPEISPMMEQYLATKEQYKDCILFYRLGDFYEMFNEDAIIASKELDIVLTGRECGRGKDDRAPMCGVPFHSYEPYVQKLISRGYKVAICEQTDNIVGKVVQRKVVRVITPGTVIDAEILNQAANSYMMSIFASKGSISFSYADISTGEVYVNVYSGTDLSQYINDQIVRIMPSEIICNIEAQAILDNAQELSKRGFRYSLYNEWAYKYTEAENTILKQYNLQSVKGFDFDDKNLIIAVGSLLAYFSETQKRELKHMKLPRVINNNQYMYIDTNTRRNLEIETTLRDNQKTGSLLWVLDSTLTSGGTRMLKSWIRQPLQDIASIKTRQDMVSSLIDNPMIREQIRFDLNEIFDIERYVARVAYGNISPKECLALARSLSKLPNIKLSVNLLNNPTLSKMFDSLIDASNIVNLINATIDPNPKPNMKEGGYINRGFNKELDRLRDLKENAENIILDIQARERETTGIKSLKVGYNKVFGYYIEVSKVNLDQVPFNYIRKQTTTNAERYITEELKQFEEQVLTSHDQAIKLEEILFQELKDKLVTFTKDIQDIASSVSTLDCVYSLAVVAIENDYVKPDFNTNNTINIENGRHPVVEKVNKTNFIPNDCLLNSDQQRTIILTGPNMAGKSTYMRQVALITYMAHIGSFVPATKADICIVDRIFTRIGASDDLAVGQSTFMVEMVEVANILNYATNNSLIILDEVGRGTSTFDGLSIAWAVVEYLSKHLNAKTLFATHYHELMQLEGLYEGVKNYCISIKEIGGKLVFLRKIMRGSATKSYGIEVASLAGLPDSVIDRAKQLMFDLEENKTHTNSSLDSELVSMLKEIDLNQMTPMQAFDTLSHFKDMV